MNRWTILSVVAAVTFDVAIVLFCGWNGLLYLAASVLFALGLHPLGARWVWEHYTLDPKQETFSYYGPLNFLTLNVGYHNEHPRLSFDSVEQASRASCEGARSFMTLLNRNSRSLGFWHSSFSIRGIHSLSRVVRDRMQAQPGPAA